MTLSSDQFASRGLDTMLIVYPLYDLISEEIRIMESKFEYTNNRTKQDFRDHW